MRPKHMNISDKRCSKHGNLPFEYFCIDHDSLFCKECKVESHRSCQKIMSVDIASKGIKSSQSFIDAMELIGHISMAIPLISIDRHTLIESIEMEASLVKDEIMKLKEEAISLIESLEKSLIEDLKQKKEKIVTNAKEIHKEIQDIERMTKEKKDMFDKAEKHGSEKQAFLAVHSCQTVLMGLDNRISTITEKKTRSTIKLNSSLLKKNIMSLATIETIELPTAIKRVQSYKRRSQIPIVHHISSTFVKKQDIQTRGTMVKGITVNYTNEIIITWIDIFKKMKVGIMVVDENGKLKNEINTLDQPCQRATIPMSENKGVLTFESSDSIQFVDFQNKTLLNYVSVNGRQLGGFAASNEYVFIGKSGSIDVLDLQGKVIRSGKTISSSVKPKYIALDRTGHIYYSDNEAVYCMRKDGEYRFIYKPPENNILHGIAIDSYSYVYIIVDSQYVWRIGPDGKFVDIVVNGEGWETLKFICFN
ncbi:uncharacterized protein [Mytilus edulis]|uniref:uncharacterized protein n=1 Tax=Mytilus edulis TaxID=6550 RepID=UPI0039EF68BB